MKDPHKVWQTLTKFDYPIFLNAETQIIKTYDNLLSL